MSSRTPHPRTILPAADRAERNRQIAEAKVAGLTWPEVAERFGVSESTARRAAAEHATTVLVPARDGRGEFDADAIVERVLRAHRLALERLDRLSLRADNDSAKTGAARSLATVGASYLDVSVRVGAVGDPGLARYRAEMDQAARTLVRLAGEHGITWEEIDRAFNSIPLVLRFAREAA